MIYLGLTGRISGAEDRRLRDEPWLSVIVPCHNGERWLASALESVAVQNDPGIELIIVDSSDNRTCEQIAKTLGDRVGLHFFRRVDLLPWTVKTNFAVEQARAEWVCMLHQDDFWLPRRCEALKNWIGNCADAVMHLHPSYIVNGTGKKLGLWRCPLPVVDTAVPADMLITRLLVQNFIAIPAPIIRRDVFLGAGGLDHGLWYTADWDLYLKIAAMGNVYYHPEPLTCFRIHKNSFTISGSHQSIKAFRAQHEIVPRRHVHQLPAHSRQTALRLAAASAAVNTALADAYNGNPAALIQVVTAVLGLGPRRSAQYLRYSRIIERLVPRVRARISREL